MTAVIHRARFLIFVATISLLLQGGGTGFAQSARPISNYPSRLPYSFSNFVWWNDSDLRELLKKKMPGLGNEIETTSGSIGRVRDALVALLKEKGVRAEVQSVEPGPLAFEPHSRTLFGQPLPDSTPPGITFSILTPQILIDKVGLSGAPADMTETMQTAVKGLQGKPFTGFAAHFAQSKLTELLNQRGYLEAAVRSDLDPPKQDGDCYLVGIEEAISSGRQYHISLIEADGGPLLAGKDLSPFFKSKAGDLAGPFAFGQLGNQLRDTYQHNGYADARIESSPSLDKEHGTVAYRLTVVAGPLYHLRSLTVKSLDASLEGKVRELFGLKPGDFWDEHAIMALYRDIANEPTLKGYRFGFAPIRDESTSAIDLTLNFFKEGGEATVTTN